MMKNRPYFKTRARRRVSLKWLIGIIALIWALCGITLVVRGLTLPTGRADVAVIFGNALEADGMPKRILAERLDLGVRCYRAGNCPILFVSGGVDGPGLNEAAAMQRYLIAQGVPEAAIVVDAQGNNTLATAQHVVAYLHAHSLTRVLLISQYYHLPRASMTFRRIGFAGLAVYTDYPAHFQIRDFYSVWREVPAFAVYAIRLGLNPSAQPVSFRPVFFMRDLFCQLIGHPHPSP